MIKSLLTEYGVPWVFNRSLYSAKLKMMRAIPNVEKIFEKEFNVQRIDIFDLNIIPIEKFLLKLPEHKKDEIISLADKAIKGKIKGFSSIELDYGSPIDWHYSPLTQTKVDNTLKWYEIPDFDPERGDIKVIWEASRFTHFFYFVRAYMITKDIRYFNAFSQQLNDWLQENNYSYGANYKCGQEATLRMINVLIAYSAFKAYGLITIKDEQNVNLLVEASYKKVASNFFYAHKCIKNNHTLSEITGLIIGAWACNDKKKLKQAYVLLDKEIQKQFFNDGGYIQFSFNYQRFALQIMEFVLNISKRTNIQLSQKSQELIKKSAYLLYQMQDKSDDIPNYGSNDGALIFPVSSCAYRDFRPIINTIFTLIDEKRIYEYGDYDEEILWFGQKGLEELPQVSLKKVSSAFHNSGFYSLRHNSGFLMTVLQNYQTRPAQMDQHHIDLWHKGVNVFCDTGTYSYAADIGKEMALTSAHNTVKLHNKEQMKKHGPFFVYDWTRSEDVEYTEDFFTGTMISKNDYKHTRSIYRYERGYLISDKVIGEGESCEFYFHTPCDVKENSNGFELYHDGKVICTVITNGVVDIKKTYRSLYYLKKEEINCVRIKGELINKICSMEFDIRLYQS